MKKMFFMAAVAALALSSCSSDELVQAPEVNGAEDGAVVFSAYEGRNTRSVDTDATDGDAQKVTIKYLKKYGFGVFAYDQGQTKLVSYLASNTYPNFMYNQKVMGYTAPASGKPQGDPIWNVSAPLGEFDHWDYTPLKYWPNHGGYVTYQAYAPYNPEISPIFNVANNGVGIRYSNSENYDLLWGASAETDDSKCFYDRQKPSVSDRTTFNFKHALAKIDFTVSYFTDNVHESTNAGLASGEVKLDKNTEIVIRSIRLVGNLPSTGVLSLYDGKWTIEKAEANIGYNTADLVKGASTIAVAPTSQAWTNLNAENAGKLTKENLALKPEGSMMVIPAGAGAKAQIEITYDVITTDESDSKNSSTVTNTIVSDNIPLYGDAHDFAGVSLEAGKWTTVNIHLGLTSAKFDAHVVDWDTSTSKDVDLPNNGFPGLTAATVSTLSVVSDVPADATGDENDLCYVAGSTNKVYKKSSTTWAIDDTVSGEVIKVDAAWYSIEAGTGTEIASSQTRYYKDGKYYTDSACTTGATAPSDLATGYYIIDGVVYKKA